ncbi:hypothetical protein N9A89_01260 [Akkermansiaceae bacterium]|nr:hypothetical protein [Akkermansiaceae bacterium]MDA7876677.1 hypothetical protein [Akkermansiaceae bacterium]MDA7931707.1 hypothetical protein [Akkermansiaceae bacterium]MDB4259776.1 hypothetical protein [Akkermansiaceae bacterium]MDB4274348.1 hypothetical protein [Akkermansiaceae bacterium]
MNCLLRKTLIATFSLLVFGDGAMAAEEKKTLSIEQAKFQMVQLYGEEKVSLRKFTIKYPELRKADKATRAAGKELRDAAQAHPKLKARFDEIAESKVFIPEKMKLWQPLFEKAEKIDELGSFRKKYDEARIHALRLEIDALKSEGYTDLAKKLDAIFMKIEPVEKNK